MMFLTPVELAELTGYKVRGRQRRWLEDRGWKHEVDRLGFPKVLRAEMERRMLGGPSAKRERDVNLKTLAA